MNERFESSSHAPSHGGDIRGDLLSWHASRALASACGAGAPPSPSPLPCGAPGGALSPAGAAAQRRRQRMDKIRHRRAAGKLADAGPADPRACSPGPRRAETRDARDASAGWREAKHEDVVDEVLAVCQRQTGAGGEAGGEGGLGVEVEDGRGGCGVGDVSGNGDECEEEGKRVEALRALQVAAAQERKHARVIRNREVALKARQAFKARLQSLEDENVTLKQQASSLHAQNSALRSQIETVQRCFRGQFAGPLHRTEHVRGDL